MRASLALLLALVGCGDASESAARPEEPVTLVRKLQPDEAGNAAAGGGVLTLENGCLFMADRSGGRTLLLWPSDARLERSPNGELRVRTGWSHPGHTVRVGEEIFVGGSQLGGGEGDSARVGPGRAIPATAAYPSGCTGPVWNVYGIHPGPLAETPVVFGDWTFVEGSDGAQAVWPAGAGEPRVTAWCDRARGEVRLAHLAPGFNRHPKPEHPVHNPPRPPAPMEISAGPDWARYPLTPGLGYRAAPADPFLAKLVERGFAVRTGEGVTLVPPGGGALSMVLDLCSAP